MNKKIIRLIVAVALSVAFLITALVNHIITGSLTSEGFVDRWNSKDSYSQIRCSFSDESGVTASTFSTISKRLSAKLKEVGVEAEDGCRNIVDAYSKTGSLTITSDRASVTVKAYGVGGDFFAFHPMKLISGNYFDGDNLNSDGLFIDNEVAWQLFGSYNVTGMNVEIGDLIIPVTGVGKVEDGLFSKEAGETEATVYVSLPLLCKYGSYGTVKTTDLSTGAETSSLEGDISSGVTDSATDILDLSQLPVDSYEMLIANPVKDFGIDNLSEILKESCNETDYSIIENSSRFSLLNRFDIIKQFGVRSMTKDNIMYPYWENRARAYEDLSALLLVLEILFIAYPVAYVFSKIILLGKYIRYNFSAKEMLCKLLENIKLLKNSHKIRKDN